MDAFHLARAAPIGYDGAMQNLPTRAAVLIEGLVTADRFHGAYEGRVAVHPAAQFAEMARNPAVVWGVARGDHDEDEFRAHDGCRWSIRRFAPAPG